MRRPKNISFAMTISHLEHGRRFQYHFASILAHIQLIFDQIKSTLVEIQPIFE